MSENKLSVEETYSYVYNLIKQFYSTDTEEEEKEVGKKVLELSPEQKTDMIILGTIRNAKLMNLLLRE